MQVVIGQIALDRGRRLDASQRLFVTCPDSATPSKAGP